jgi:hypothetical protein
MTSLQFPTFGTPSFRVSVFGQSTSPATISLRPVESFKDDILSLSPEALMAPREPMWRKLTQPNGQPMILTAPTTDEERIRQYEQLESILWANATLETKVSTYYENLLAQEMTGYSALEEKARQTAHYVNALAAQGKDNTNLLERQSLENYSLPGEDSYDHSYISNQIYRAIDWNYPRFTFSATATWHRGNADWCSEIPGFTEWLADRPAERAGATYEGRQIVGWYDADNDEWQTMWTPEPLYYDDFLNAGAVEQSKTAASKQWNEGNGISVKTVKLDGKTITLRVNDKDGAVLDMLIDGKSARMSELGEKSSLVVLVDEGGGKTTLNIKPASQRLEGVSLKPQNGLGIFSTSENPFASLGKLLGLSGKFTDKSSLVVALKTAINDESEELTKILGC